MEKREREREKKGYDLEDEKKIMERLFGLYSGGASTNEGIRRKRLKLGKRRDGKYGKVFETGSKSLSRVWQRIPVLL